MASRCWREALRYSLTSVSAANETVTNEKRSSAPRTADRSWTLISAATSPLASRTQRENEYFPCNHDSYQRRSARGHVTSVIFVAWECPAFAPSKEQWRREVVTRHSIAPRHEFAPGGVGLGKELFLCAAPGALLLSRRRTPSQEHKSPQHDDARAREGACSPIAAPPRGTHAPPTPVHACALPQADARLVPMPAPRASSSRTYWTPQHGMRRARRCSLPPSRRASRMRASRMPCSMRPSSGSMMQTRQLRMSQRESSPEQNASPKPHPTCRAP
jgi:hypothetical protein